MSTISAHRPHRMLVGLSAALLLGGLSGCGLTDDRLDPGLAARVGDTTIELDQVDDAAVDLCDMITFLADEGSASAVPGSVVRDNTLQYEVLRELGDQLADEYDVEAGETYRAALAQNESQLSELGVEPDLLDEVVPTVTSVDYFFDIVQQIGQEQLGLTPEEDVQQEGFAAGLKVAQRWEADQGLEVNPRFSDISLGEADELLTTGVDDLSVPVSDFAKQAREGVDPANPDPAYAESLPDSQRCG